MYVRNGSSAFEVMRCPELTASHGLRKHITKNADNEASPHSCGERLLVEEIQVLCPVAKNWITVISTATSTASTAKSDPATHRIADKV